jgi:hypothetical protein
MRRLSLYFFTALFAFVIGLLAYLLWFAPNTAHTPQEVSLCDLERNPKLFNGRLVRVKAVLYSDLGGPYIYDWSCGSANIYTYPLVDVKGLTALNPELQNWVKNIGGIGASGEGWEANVIVVGRLDADYHDPNDDGFAHRFRLVPEGIEQLTPLYKRQQELSGGE